MNIAAVSFIVVTTALDVRDQDIGVGPAGLGDIKSFFGRELDRQRVGGRGPGIGHELSLIEVNSGFTQGSIDPLELMGF